jgi:hypothetical protein
VRVSAPLEGDEHGTDEPADPGLSGIRECLPAL